MVAMTWLEQVKFDEKGLVPVIAQEATTGEVLMLAYANREAIEHTLSSGEAHYWSRSRGSLWRKGESSGNEQKVVELRLDCDGDTVLYRVRQSGPACHTMARSCSFRIESDGEVLEDGDSPGHVLDRVAAVVADRHDHPKEGSYTNYLFHAGLDKVLKKVGEESTEVVIAAKNDGDEELRSEIADLLYHLVVLARTRNLSLEAVWNELDERFGRKPRARGSHSERKST